MSYHATYTNIGGHVGILVWSPLTALATGAISAGSVIENSRVKTYETEEPIRFHVSPEPGMRYWVNSVFDGDVFRPRIAVLNTENTRVHEIVPDEPCASGAAASVASAASTGN